MDLKHINKIIINVCLFVASHAMADETNSDFVQKLWPPSESSLIQKYMLNRFYEGEAGLNNYYAKFHKPDNCINSPLIIITGADDPVPAWFDTALNAMKLGFKSIYIIEIRGQGQSQRVAGNEAKLLHVEKFDNYKLDLISALRSIEDLDGFLDPVYVISHSTGSLVLANAFKDIKRQLPSLKIKSMSFWAPLIKMNLQPWVSNPFVHSAISTFEKIYSSCCGLFVAQKIPNVPFSENKLTSDEGKYKRLQKLKKSYGLGSTGVSLRWAVDALTETQLVQSDQMKSLKIPILIMKSEKDFIVSNEYNFDSANVKVETIPLAFHSIHIEKDEIFDKVFKITFDFFLGGNNKKCSELKKPMTESEAKKADADSVDKQPISP